MDQQAPIFKASGSGVVGAPTVALPQITPAMIEAGFKVLCDSGIAEDYMDSDKLLVAEIFRAMFNVKE